MRCYHLLGPSSGEQSSVPSPAQGETGETGGIWARGGSLGVQRRSAAGGVLCEDRDVKPGLKCSLCRVKCVFMGCCQTAVNPHAVIPGMPEYRITENREEEPQTSH